MYLSISKIFICDKALYKKHQVMVYSVQLDTIHMEKGIGSFSSSLLPDTSFPFLQGLLAWVLGLSLIDLLEHHKIDPMLSVHQFILKK